MNSPYDDIRSRIAESPQWFDEQAVPRYCKFAPDEAANIYADRVALVLIACQSCRKTFRVCFSSCNMDRLRGQLQHEALKASGEFKPTLWAGVESGSIHYGDPPNIRCCPSGPTMNCLDLRIIEAWDRVNFEWVRKSEYEVLLPDHDEYEGESV